MELKGTALLADANLQAYYRLEADGTDDSPNGYDVVAGTVPSYVSAKFGNGGDFEASSSQYLAIADASCPNLEISGSKTWGAWVKAESLSAANSVLSKIAGANVGQKLDITSDGTVRFQQTGLISTNISSDIKITTGKWYFICGIWESSINQYRLWINGTKKEASTTGSVSDTNGNFAIGADYGNSGSLQNYFDGIIDDAFVFNRALTDAEVTKLYTTTSPAFLNNLISYKNN